MTLATIDYTDANQMLADYAARRRRLYQQCSVPVVLPEPPQQQAKPESAPDKPAPVFLGGRRRNGLPWTEQECEIVLDMAEQGLSARAIATRIRRSAEGVIHKARMMGVIVHLRPTKEFLTPFRGEEVTNLYKMVVNQDLSSRARARGIISVCAKSNNVPIDAIFGESRSKFAILARQQAMWLAAKETGLSLAELGRIFGRDHTTVIHGIRRENDRTGENVRGLGGRRK